MHDIEIARDEHDSMRAFGERLDFGQRRHLGFGVLHSRQSKASVQEASILAQERPTDARNAFRLETLCHVQSDLSLNNPRHALCRDLQCRLPGSAHIDA